RTLDDGKLHVVAEPAVRGLESFVMPFDPAVPSPYRGKILRHYYEQVPGLAVAELGRSAGYTLRPEGLGLAGRITEGGMDALFGPPMIGSPERRAWEAALRASGQELP